MSRPLSHLVAAHIRDGTGGPRLITLHDHDRFAAGTGDLALAVAPDATVIGLESSKGVFVGKRITGYTWFVGPLDRPSPISFGDALVEIERFLWDEIDRQQAMGGPVERPFLLGTGQGAIMAIAAAAAIPDLLSGVVAIDGALPVVAGWEPPLVPLAGLPVLLVDPLAPDQPEPVRRRPGDAEVLRGDRLAAVLGDWGGVIDRRTVGDDEVQPAVSAWLRGHPTRPFTPDPPDLP